MFIKQSFEEASDHQKFYKLLNADEKAAVFNTLMAVAFDFVEKPWPKMDKQYFTKRKNDDLNNL